MLLDIELDILRFLDRATLEELQMHSLYLRDLVKRQERKLPLRRIHNIHIKDGAARIRLTEQNTALEPDETDGETMFHRFNNAFIRRLQLSFLQENLQLLHYLRAIANDLQCQIAFLGVEVTKAGIDYALVDLLGTHFKPLVCETMTFSELPEDYAVLFERDALHGNIKYLVYMLCGPPAPTCIIPKLFGVRVVETCTITTRIDPRPWIGTFIRMFETSERGTDMVRLVTLHDTHVYEVPPSPRHSVEVLGTPRRIDAPTPYSGLTKKYPWKHVVLAGTTTTESSVAERFVFENATAARKLELYAWTIEHSGVQNALNYAFRLQVVHMQ